VIDAIVAVIADIGLFGGGTGSGFHPAEVVANALGAIVVVLFAYFAMRGRSSG
jgi:hypothetical protein